MTADFSTLRATIERLPKGTDRHPCLVTAEARRRRLYFTPLGHLNPEARLVVVGITPGPNQMKLAIKEVQAAKGSPESEVLARVKTVAAFGSCTMRPNLLRMLRHFKAASRLGLRQEEDFWGQGAGMLQSTSVVPHAAFSVGPDGTEKPFAGRFDEVQKNDALRECFESGFLPVVEVMRSDAVWVGLGPTPGAALNWCVDRGMLRAEQIALFAHPSTNSGSQVSYFLRELARESLHERNPVRRRCDWLDQAHATSLRAFGALSLGAKNHETPTADVD